MRSYRAACAVVVIVAASAAVATPGPPYALEADLAWSSPAGTDGLLLVPPSDPASTTVVHAWIGPTDPGARLLHADRVVVSLKRWVDSALPEPGQGPPIPDPGSNPSPITYQTAGIDHTNAILRLVEVGESAQTLTMSRASNTSHELPRWTRLVDAECRIENPPRSGSVDYPQDPQRQPGSGEVYTALGERRLHAACDTATLEAERPHQVLLYGVTVRLASDQEPDRVIRTGTFTEPHPTTGLPQRVTQILELWSVQAPLRFVVPAASGLHVWAPAFDLEGALEAPKGHGALRWGAWAHEGPVGPFDVDGRFRFDWSPGGRVLVAGSTVTGPPSYGAGAGGFPAGRAAWAVAAAGVAGFLLWRYAWPLFTRLLPDRILDHPRRARLFELVSRRPGIGLAEASRALGMPWSKASHHAEALHRAGRIRIHREGRLTALVPGRAGSPAEVRRAALLEKPRARSILNALRSEPGLGRHALAARLGITAPRVTQAIAPLVEAGLVSCTLEGRRRRYHAT